MKALWPRFSFDLAALQARSSMAVPEPLTVLFPLLLQGPVIYAQLDHSGGRHSDKINKSESVVYADIRKNWGGRYPKLPKGKHNLQTGIAWTRFDPENSRVAFDAWARTNACASRGKAVSVLCVNSLFNRTAVRRCCMLKPGKDFPSKWPISSLFLSCLTREKAKTHIAISNCP